jgi:hypothetical protein
LATTPWKVLLTCCAAAGWLNIKAEDRDSENKAPRKSQFASNLDLINYVCVLVEKQIAV